MDLRGKTAVVTGGTGGLGYEICRALAREGVHVCLVYLKSEETAWSYAEQLSETGTKATAVQADITTEEGIDRMFEYAVQTFGGVDILVLDAAFKTTVPFSDTDALDKDIWEHIINFNLTSPYLAARKAAEYMRKQGGGRIVTISSVAGHQPLGSSIAYSVSKAALVHLTKCLAVGLAPDILVNDVAPGLMLGTRNTGNLTKDHVAKSIEASVLKKDVDKLNAAEAVILFCRTDSITGQSLLVDCGRVF